MLKKFDNDDAHHAPKSAELSVWTPLFLVVNGAIFLIGISSGLRVALTILNIALGMSIPLPLGPLLVSCCLMGLIKCYDRDDDDDELWTADDDEPEEDQEEDSSFVVWMNYITMNGYDQPLQDVAGAGSIGLLASRKKSRL